MKVRVARADAPDSVFAHKDSRVRVVPQVAGESGYVRHDFGQHAPMTFGRHQQPEPG